MIERKEILSARGFKPHQHTDRRGSIAWCLEGPDGSIWYDGASSGKDHPKGYFKAHRPVYRSVDRIWKDGPTLQMLAREMLAELVSQDHELGRLIVSVQHDGKIDLYMDISIHTRAKADIWNDVLDAVADTFEEAVVELWMKAYRKGWITWLQTSNRSTIK